ncbi:hypothetical protein K440DRAFT_151158 [Wilcoxina mikolae CBS 423.85]|nr:hypothetical protein K440DRAFT_151158 [Wilcoxina mikolae CBS 423.85]
MTKRSAETQLTKDTMSTGFSFSAGGGGPDDSMDLSKTADASTLATRKIAPLRKRGGARGAAARSAASAASPLPNLFANIPGGAFGSANTNGASSPSPTPSFGFGDASTPPAQTFGNGSNGGFQFGQPQQEQPKPNPFASIAPASPAPTNGTSGGMFGNASSGAFGNSNAAPTNGVFGNSNTASTAAPSFTFGATINNDKPASTGFTFGSSNAAVTSSAPTTGGLFGNSASISTPFTFGAAPTPTTPKEETKPAATGFSFGQPATASAPEPPKSAAPQFAFANPSFGAPAATSTTSAGFGSALPTDAADGKKPSGFTFGKPADATAAEPSTGSLFAKPSGAQPAPTTGGFTFEQKPKETLSGASLFGKPAEPSKPMFGFEEKKDEPTKPISMFAGFGATNNTVKKDEPQAPLFGMPTEKKESTPLFGPPASVEKKEEPKSLFGAPPATSGGFSFGAPKAAEKPAQKLDFANPMFGPKPADIKPAAPLKPITFPASPFGPLPSTTKAPIAATTPVTAPTPAAAPTPTPAPPTANAMSSVRMRSPPLSSDSHKWSANQLTDYYNLFALRSLNHFFREELSKQDIFADLTPLCDVYVNEVKKIKGLMEKNQRYKFGDPSLGSGVPGKRAGEDNDERGGGKRRAMGEEPKVTFASPNKSSSSQALASVLGGFSSTKPMDESQKQTDKKSPKPASIFDNPSPQPVASSWVNPFSKPDTSNLPDDPEPMYDDDEPASSKRSGGLFNRISPPKDASASEPKRTGGLFDRISPPKEEIKPFGTSLFGAGGDQTWSPDKGLKFSSAPSPSSSLFSGAGTNNKGGLFGGTNGTSTASSGLFGSKPSSAAATPSALTSAENSEAENGTPNEGDPSDAQPPATTETDLSKQGPGEEDEDSLFQARSIVYDMSGPKPQKEGVGTLRVLKNRISGKSRIIVRSDIGKVVMNVALKGNIKYILQEKRLLRVPEFLESGGIKTWGARIGKEDVAGKLLSTVEEVKGSS